MDETQVAAPSDWRCCVAPMLAWTDVHCRTFHRLLSRRVRLYTEMITTGALRYGDRERLLAVGRQGHPVACQLAGSDPAELAQAARWAEERGYDEINLNCGCPSERVRRGGFGACLMDQPALVADCLRAMRDAVSLPVTVKHRVGLDERQDYGFTRDFVGTLWEAGCRVFIVHARAALLSGVSTRRNRRAPPLRPDYARRLKEDFPDLVICLNGGLTDLSAARAELPAVDGVMIGRAAYRDPWLLSAVDREFYGAPDGAPLTRFEVVERLSDYLVEISRSDPRAPRAVARHTLGLLKGLPGARRWRCFLSLPESYERYGAEVLRRAWDEAQRGAD